MPAHAQDPATNIVVTRTESLYTVEAHGAPLNDVLGRLSKEAGFRIESPVASDGSATVDLRLVDVHLERVLEKLLTKQNHLIVYARGTERIDKIILLSRPAAAPAGAKPPGAQANGPAGPGGATGPGGVRTGMQPGVNPNARAPVQPGTRPGMQLGTQPPMQPPGMQSSAPAPPAHDPRVAAAAAAAGMNPAQMAALRSHLASSGVDPATVGLAPNDLSEPPPDGSDPGAWAFGAQNGGAGQGMEE